MQIIDPPLVEALTGVVSQAGRVILDLAPNALDIRQKDDRSPVTAADEAAQAVILEGLARLMPGVPVVAEEQATRPAAGLGDIFALVDPLDGTREFIAGREEYTVNLAIVEERIPILGLVFLPARGRLYCGFSDFLAERLDLAAGEPARRARTIARLRTRPVATPGLTAVVSRSHMDAATDAFLAGLPVATRLPSGSSAKFGLLAEGAADVYPRLAPTHEWDIAAGHAVLAAAGGTVVRPDGTPLLYGAADRDFRVPAFVAWGDPAAMTRFGGRETAI